MCFICPNGTELAQIFFLWLIPLLLGMAVSVAMFIHAKIFSFTFSAVVSVAIVSLVYRDFILQPLVVLFFSLIPIAWLCSFAILADRRCSGWSKVLAVVVVLYHPLSIVPVLRWGHEYVRQEKEREQGRQQIKAQKIAIAENLCARAQQQRTGFYRNIHASLKQPTDVLFRSGHSFALDRKDAGRPLTKEPDICPADFSSYLFSHYQKRVKYRYLYPSIRCFEDHNKREGLYSPSEWCPEYQKENNETYAQPRSRFHLIVGEDDPERIIRPTEAEQATLGRLHVEVHSVRLFDTQSQEVVGEIPLLLSDDTDFAKDVAACYTSDLEAAKMILENTIISPEERQMYVLKTKP